MGENMDRCQGKRDLNDQPRKQGGMKQYISLTRQFYGRDFIPDSRIYITLTVL